jgi:hypothetical protein
LINLVEYIYDKIFEEIFEEYEIKVFKKKVRNLKEIIVSEEKVGTVKNLSGKSKLSIYNKGIIRSNIML